MYDELDSHMSPSFTEGGGGEPMPPSMTETAGGTMHFESAEHTDDISHMGGPIPLSRSVSGGGTVHMTTYRSSSMVNHDLTTIIEDDVLDESDSEELEIA